MGAPDMIQKNYIGALPISWECFKCCSDGKKGMIKVRCDVGLSSILPVSVNRQEILVDYRYLGRPKISIHKKVIQSS